MEITIYLIDINTNCHVFLLLVVSAMFSRFIYNFAVSFIMMDFRMVNYGKIDSTFYSNVNTMKRDNNQMKVQVIMLLLI